MSYEITVKNVTERLTKYPELLIQEHTFYPPLVGAAEKRTYSYWAEKPKNRHIGNLPPTHLRKMIKEGKLVIWENLSKYGGHYTFYYRYYCLPVSKEMLPTPTVEGNNNRKGLSAKSGNGLATAVKLFATPTAQDAKNSSLPPSQAKRDNLAGDLLRANQTGKLNPEFVEWMMSYPIGWTELPPEEKATGKKTKRQRRPSTRTTKIEKID